MIKKLRELLKEAFQDFDLLPYEYEISVESFAYEINKNGTIKQCRRAGYKCSENHVYIDDKPVDLRRNYNKYKRYLNYKEVLVVRFFFKSKKIYPVKKMSPIVNNSKNKFELWKKSQFDITSCSRTIKKDLIEFKDFFEDGIIKADSLLSKENISLQNDYNINNFRFQNQTPDELIRGSRGGYYHNKLTFPIIYNSMTFILL